MSPRTSLTLLGSLLIASVGTAMAQLPCRSEQCKVGAFRIEDAGYRIRGAATLNDSGRYQLRSDSKGAYFNQVDWAVVSIGGTLDLQATDPRLRPIDRPLPKRALVIDLTKPASRASKGLGVISDSSAQLRAVWRLDGCSAENLFNIPIDSEVSAGLVSIVFRKDNRSYELRAGAIPDTSCRARARSVVHGNGSGDYRIRRVGTTAWVLEARAGSTMRLWDISATDSAASDLGLYALAFRLSVAPSTELPTCTTGHTCFPSAGACGFDINTRRVGRATFDDSGSFRSDGKGDYVGGVGNAHVVMGFYGELWSNISSEPAKQTSRYISFDLNHPVPDGGGVPLGVINDPHGQMNIMWRTVGNRISNLHSIPVGTTVLAEQAHIGFNIDGKYHQFQVGPVPKGGKPCYSGATTVSGEGTSQISISRPDSTTWVFYAPTGSIGRLFDDHHTDTFAVDRGRYYFSMRLVLRAAP